MWASPLPPLSLRSIEEVMLLSQFQWRFHRNFMHIKNIDVEERDNENFIRV
jgi:hypothetical protein